MLKTPVVNPLLALIVRRALVRCGGAPEFARGWSACAGWTPLSERDAETAPSEWFTHLPVLVQNQIDEALDSEFFQVGAGLRKGSSFHPSPEELADMLYGTRDSQAHFSQVPARACAEPRALGRSWNGAPTDASWVIAARPHADAWLEVDPAAVWNQDLPRVCLRLGAGLWFHPPARRIPAPEKCPSLVGALEALLGTLGWDQWVFPLAEALEHAIAQRLCPGKSEDWSQLPRASKWSALPDWTWSHANHLYGDTFGALVAAIAFRSQQRFPLAIARYAEEV